MLICGGLLDCLYDLFRGLGGQPMNMSVFLLPRIVHRHPEGVWKARLLMAKIELLADSLRTLVSPLFDYAADENKPWSI